MPVRTMSGKRINARALRRILRIESQLGSGGSGFVYKAWHKRLCKYVVVKEVKHGTFGDLETRRNEVEALKTVKSAYLPQVFDFLSKGGASYTIMEFIEGDSFDKLLERGQAFTEAQVVKWYAQLASALETIHKQDICHRDIKPSNIMLTPCGDVCLIDFNAALVGGNDSRLVSRSLGYASPEQYELYQRVNGASNSPKTKLNDNDSGASGPDYVETLLLEGDNLTQMAESCNNCQPCADGPCASSPDANYASSPDAPRAASPEDSRASSPCAQAAATPAPRGIDWKQSDIYSLGATMHHLLTGKRPSEMGNSPLPHLEPGQSGKGIEYIIKRSMRLEPSERFSSGAKLSEAIRNIDEPDAGQDQDNPQPKKGISVIMIIAIAVLFGLRKSRPASAIPKRRKKRQP